MLESFIGSAIFFNEDQWENSTLTKEFENLALLISKLQLGQNETLFEALMVMNSEDIIEVDFCISKLVDMALQQRMRHPSLTLTHSPLDLFKCWWETPNTMKLACSTSCPFVSYILIDNALEFTTTNAMKVCAISEKLNKICATNFKWQHQQTIDSFFKST